MIRRLLFSIITVLLVFPSITYGQDKVAKTIQLTLEDKEYWWGGFVSEGHNLPFNRMSNIKVDLYGENKSNQSQPLLLPSQGRYVWSESPFSFHFVDNKLNVTSHDSLVSGKAGNTLASAYKYVSQKFFPPSKKMPDPLLFSSPQWNTWIELTYNQNQEDVLKYAKGILENGFEPGVLMIDDTWQEDYGVWNFHPGRFPKPKVMVDTLHAWGFKVMLWICPFVSPDSPSYRQLKQDKALILQGGQDKKLSWQEANTEPALIQWWNGASAVVDFSNPAGVKWFKSQMVSLKEKYGVDGYKLDAGDASFYSGNIVSYEDLTPNQHSELFGQFGLDFPLNEYRAMWKMAGQPLAQRLWDKGHNWKDLSKLIPQILLQGIEGYAFTCPDMIGGGEFSSFLNKTSLDQELVVRSAQCHALMPMMQFSAAPWRVLDEVHLEAVKQAVALRKRKTPLIMELAKRSQISGEPIVNHMEFVFPKQGFENMQDQFMLGEKVLVAPMLTKASNTRQVVLPPGKWKADDGKVYRGPAKISIQVPLNRLPYFELIK